MRPTMFLIRNDDDGLYYMGREEAPWGQRDDAKRYPVVDATKEAYRIRMTGTACSLEFETAPFGHARGRDGIESSRSGA